MRYPQSPNRRLTPALLLASSLLAVACGDDDPSRPEAQPAPGASEFQEGNFDRLPRYPGADPVNDPAIRSDVTTQSFTVATATPEQVIGFYDRELDTAGWRTVQEPQQLGAEQTYRGIWRHEDQELTVSTTQFAGYDTPGGTRTTQFSLSLGPT